MTEAMEGCHRRHLGDGNIAIAVAQTGGACEDTKPISGASGYYNDDALAAVLSQMATDIMVIMDVNMAVVMVV